MLIVREVVRRGRLRSVVRAECVAPCETVRGRLSFDWMHAPGADIVRTARRIGEFVDLEVDNSLARPGARIGSGAVESD